MSDVIDLDKHRQSRALIAATQSNAASRKLDPSKSSLPPCVHAELLELYIAVFAGQTTWIAQDAQGYIYEVTITLSEYGTYDHEAICVDSVQHFTPKPTA